MRANPRRKMELRIHSRRRARERLGLTLNRNRRAEILAQLLNGSARFLGIGHAATRTQWVCQYAGCKFRVVFDERLKEITTIIPWERQR